MASAICRYVAHSEAGVDGGGGAAARLRRKVVAQVRGFAEAGVAGADDRFGAVGEVKLGERVGNMVGDGLRAHAEDPGDCGVVATRCNEAEHVKARAQ